MMFINFTNHPSAYWSEEQLAAAKAYGEICDIPFPAVDPAADETRLSELARQYADEILSRGPDAVLCQGEMTLAFAVAYALMRRGVRVLAACSARNVTERAGSDGTTLKSAEFRFVRFRAYVLL